MTALMTLTDTTTRSLDPRPMPPVAGIGLRSCHHAQIERERPAVGWFEAHSENYFGRGGPARRALAKVREHYPLSLHGVGLSLGSVDPLDLSHLSQIAELNRAFQPQLVSEHLSWGSVGGRHLNDLLPLPYTAEALHHMVQRVTDVQDYLGRQILIENVSSYLTYLDSEMTEWEFLVQLAQESRCGLLLDVNNMYINASNHGFDAVQFLEAVPTHLVQEIHLAGHAVRQIVGQNVLIDTHGTSVCQDVWQLYALSLLRFGRVPTLIEWDTDIPSLGVLLAEAEKANELMRHHYDLAA